LETLKKTFEIDPPDPAFEYYLDYATFYGNGPKTIEHLSEDFNVPGFLADQKYYIEGQVFCETYSNPGYLTATGYGMNGGWALCPILKEDGIDFRKSKSLPFEIEIAFVPPESKRPWNLWWNVGLYDEQGKMYSWQPGIKNIPEKGYHFFNKWTSDPNLVEDNPVIHLQFDPEIPQALFRQKSLDMLIQVTDDTHIRVGLRVDGSQPWTLSRPFDTSPVFGKISKFAYPCFVSYQGSHVGGNGWGVGNYPSYQRFLIDYVHFRFGLSTNP
jgi:hypothetical protein